jgi:cytoskeletal protein CcmA (bactofilin family)
LVQLGPRDRLIGQLYIEGDVRLGGVIEGQIEATGDVEIDDLAKVKASVAGRDVSIRGHVNGSVVARKRLVVARSGSLIGDVRVQRLVIQDGASFSGKVSMGPAAEAPPVASPAAAVVAEPDVPAVVEAPAPIVAPPVVVAPPARADGKDGRANAALPPKGKPKPKRR